MPAGRPTKYTKALIKKAKEYIKSYETHSHAIPSISGLSLVLDVTRETLHAWARDEEKKEFSYILAKIKETQHSVLISKGLTGEFNSNIAKLVLGKHGYHDKGDLNLGSDTKNPVKIVIEVVDGSTENTDS